MDIMRESPAPNQAAGNLPYQSGDEAPDLRKALLAGLVGGIVASAGYLLYQRLEDEQKNAIRNTVVGFVQDKIGEIRSQLKM